MPNDINPLRDALNAVAMQQPENASSAPEMSEEEPEYVMNVKDLYNKFLDDVSSGDANALKNLQEGVMMIEEAGKAMGEEEPKNVYSSNMLNTSV